MVHFILLEMARFYKEEYEVERIISCRLATDGKISYLVRWKGYNSNDDTWEPEENLHGCKDLIVDFFKERDAIPARKDGCLVLHLKARPPRSDYSPNSSLEYTDCSPKNTPQRLNHVRSRRHKPQHHSADGSDHLVTYGTLIKESPYFERLRLTPERLNHALEKAKWERERLSPGSSRSPSRSATEKHQDWVLRRGKFTSHVMPRYAYSKPNVTSSKRGRSRWGPVLFQVVLTAFFSVSLSIILFSFLIFDLS